MGLRDTRQGTVPAPPSIAPPLAPPLPLATAGSRKLLKAGGGRGTTEEEYTSQPVQGYDVIYPSEDRGDNWAAPTEFRVERYLNGRSRLIGGVLLTTQLSERAEPSLCTARFPHLVAQGGCAQPPSLGSQLLDPRTSVCSPTKEARPLSHALTSD
jgi:hypothetical protein